jgi:hypothetical protein
LKVEEQTTLQSYQFGLSAGTDAVEDLVVPHVPRGRLPAGRQGAEGGVHHLQVLNPTLWSWGRRWRESVCGQGHWFMFDEDEDEDEDDDDDDDWDICLIMYFINYVYKSSPQH